MFLEARRKAEIGLWKKCVDHVIKFEDEYWNKDQIMDDLDVLIVNVRDDDVDDDDNDAEIDLDDESETMNYGLLDMLRIRMMLKLCERNASCTTRESVISAWLNGLSVIFAIVGFISVI